MPGRNGSMRISACDINERSTEIEALDLRSSGSEDLYDVRRSELAAGGGRSIRRTEAPYDERRKPQNGPGARPASSSTRRPVRGGAEGMSALGSLPCFSSTRDCEGTCST